MDEGKNYRGVLKPSLMAMGLDLPPAPGKVDGVGRQSRSGRKRELR
jgi:hypothetical protein